MDFDFQPTLKGKLITLRPLKETDFPALYEVSSDPLLWEQHPQKERYQIEVFRDFFDVAMKSGGALLAQTIEDGTVIGSSRFYDLIPAKNQVAIGYSFVGRKYWGHTYNKEMKHLMLHHAFKYVQEVVFHIGEKNIRSQTSIQRLGATLLEKGHHKLPNGTLISELVFHIKKDQFSTLSI